MKKILPLSFFFILVFYLLFWPVAIEPVAWQAPKNPGYTGVFSANQALSQIHRLKVNGHVGPEDVVIDSQGRPLVGVLSGDLLRLTESGEFETWVNTGGRPLGMEFDSKGNLWVADAYLGLLKIDENGQIMNALSKVGDSPIHYADDLDIAANGKVYLSDASTRFTAPEYGTYEASLLDINEHGGSGRIIEYDTQTQQALVLLDGLNFANGVAVSHDEEWILVNETGSYRILRVGIAEHNRGYLQVVIDNLPGFPDNINPASNGLYWVGLVSPRSAALDALSEYPFLRKIVQRLPSFMRPKAQAFGHLIAISEQGKVVHNLQDPLGIYGYVTGAAEQGDTLYVSSLHETALGQTVNLN